MKSVLARLSIDSAEFYAYHGVRAEEQQLGGRYQVDVDIYYDARKAVVSDTLSDTVNYEEALFIVNEHMDGDEHYELIETLAFDMAAAIVERFPQVNHVTVRVRKLAVPVQHIVDHVEAEITVMREG